MFLEISHKIHKQNTCARVSFLKFIKKETLQQLFSCELCEISKNTFFTEHHLPSSLAGDCCFFLLIFLSPTSSHLFVASDRFVYFQLCICPLFSLSFWRLRLFFEAIFSPSERYQDIQDNPEYNSVLPSRIIMKIFAVNMLNFVLLLKYETNGLKTGLKFENIMARVISMCNLKKYKYLTFLKHCVKVRYLRKLRRLLKKHNHYFTR